MRSAPRAPILEEESVRNANDAPPERFVERVSDEGGDVYVAPVLEALRATLRSKRTPAADASADAPQPETGPEGTEAHS